MDVFECARNNAVWCEAVCRSHGRRGSFSDDAWTSARRTPPLFPDAVTLRPGVDANELLAAIDTAAPGCSIKDSFAHLDLSAFGFSILFNARWIFSEPTPPPSASPCPLEWVDVTDANGFRSWEAAWISGGGLPEVMRAALLDDPIVTVLAGMHDEQVVAGVIAAQTGSTVGLTNFFSPGDAEPWWTSCVGALTARFPRAVFVGYESGDALDIARRSGFSALAPLRVWIRSD